MNNKEKTKMIDIYKKQKVKKLIYSQCKRIDCWNPVNSWSLSNQYVSACRC